MLAEGILSASGTSPHLPIQINRKIAGYSAGNQAIVLTRRANTEQQRELAKVRSAEPAFS